MFLAKFNQASGASFTADKNDNMPYIGTVLAGKSSSSIVNGTIFEREGYSTKKTYLCMNTPNEEYPEYPNVEIVQEVSAIEVVQMFKELGKGIRVAPKAAVEAVEETAQALL